MASVTVPVSDETEINDSNETNELTAFERLHIKYHTRCSITFIITVILGLIALTIYTIKRQSDIDKWFWINQSVKYAVIMIVQIIVSYGVTCGMKVNYSRKVMHVLYFVWPQILDTVILAFEKNVLTELWNIMVVYLCLIVLLDPIRKRSNFLEFLFKSVDRPEDRPYTNFWFISQLTISIVIISCAAVFFQYIEKDNLLYIPLLILVLGDGLAEPVGIRFGKHTYNVKGLFVSNTYVRSLEGSSCVWISAIASTLIYYNDIEKSGIVFTLVLLPPLVTFAEAYSPHTWDNPIILITGYITMIISYYI